MISLKDIRLKNNKTQQQMADLLNIGLTTYHQYEKSERDIPYKVANKIADIFQMKIDEIFLPTRFTVSKK